MAAPAGLASTTGARAPEPHETAGIGEPWPRRAKIPTEHSFQRFVVPPADFAWTFTAMSAQP